MAGRDPATQFAARPRRERAFKRADARLLDGRLRVGHGEVGC
jgi:hypothetical protein